ncbi:MAG: hypothetical protein LJE69_00125 [Thiohalocapsa sp.]|uniref:hypothetical protein n=1 Tax=Thiohalocapsa sp. TaxID=2497641 RepID=UPI0025E8F462|nr:hypothetical protein [Thiohalocapsa sp.]MCG6939643.1 hypothetical protein [Thiohalocapsa sp.]
MSPTDSAIAVQGRRRGGAAAWSAALLMVLLAALALAASPRAAVAAAATAAEGAADEASAEPSPEEVLNGLAQQVDGLDQGLKTQQEQIEGNRQAIAQQGERLDAELKRMDPMSLRLDSLAQQLEQAQAQLEKHESRIEDNSVKLYETLMGSGDTAQAIDALRAKVQGLERALRRASAAPPAVENGAETGAADATAAGGERARAALLPAALGLLLPAGILLYAVARAGWPAAAGVPAAARMSAPALLLALGGAALGFMVLGVGIRDGASSGGLLGAPLAFLPALFRLSPDAGLPDIAGALLEQLPLVVAMALLVAVTAGPRLSAAGGSLVGVVLGGLLLPLFGHWTALPAGGDAQAAGWLVRHGFSDSGGVVSAALVGGSAALGLALGLGRRAAGRPDTGAAGHEPALLVVAVLLLWIGWLVPRLAAAEADAAAALMLLSWASAVGAVMTSALFGALFRGGRGRLRGLPAALVAGVVAAPALGTQAGALTALIFGALVGLLHTLFAPLLQRRDTAAEPAAAFSIAGLCAALAPALVGPNGYLFMPVAEDLPMQLLGAGVASALGLGGGLLLGLALRLMPGLSSARAASAKRPQAEAAVTAA